MKVAQYRAVIQTIRREVLVAKVKRELPEETATALMKDPERLRKWVSDLGGETQVEYEDVTVQNLLPEEEELIVKRFTTGNTTLLCISHRDGMYSTRFERGEESVLLVKGSEAAAKSRFEDSVRLLNTFLNFGEGYDASLSNQD